MAKYSNLTAHIALLLVLIPALISGYCPGNDFSCIHDHDRVSTSLFRDPVRLNAPLGVRVVNPALCASINFSHLKEGTGHSHDTGHIREGYVTACFEVIHKGKAETFYLDSGPGVAGKKVLEISGARFEVSLPDVILRPGEACEAYATLVIVPLRND